ncbi:S1 family peptidase [Ottowia sp.]|uniref:S1 family peptidase n=1 Tax=Ottowia sp. TaxID=1898956 RepID=UPI003A873F9A
MNIPKPLTTGFAALLALWLGLNAHWAHAQTQAAKPAPTVAAPADSALHQGAATGRSDDESKAPSADAQQAYRVARDKLVQVRTLRRKTSTQSSTGSGFYVSSGGLIVTNFHVAADLALEPERHRGVVVSMDGAETPVELLAFDVQHDLAVLRPAGTAGAHAALALRPATQPMTRGERIYSLGNPLDVGFAVTEGIYNGLVQRSFYPRIFFGGALNPGMSGGPALDAAGQVVGVNVSKRVDAEMVSFLVPVQFVAQLIEQAHSAQPITQPAYAELTRQLKNHQEVLVDRYIAAPARHERYGSYSVPVPDEALARCWGDGRGRDSNSLFDFERSDCTLDSGVYAGLGDIGDLSVRYEAYDGRRLQALQFAQIYGQSFQNESFRTRGNRHLTAVECKESFVDTQGLTQRAVLCLSAYRKLEGLYNVSLLMATVQQPKSGVLSRLNASGLTFDNAERLIAHYMRGFAWEGKP